jgi:hypothetical protein
MEMKLTGLSAAATAAGAAMVALLVITPKGARCGGAILLLR